MTKSISQNTEQYPASEAAPTGNPGPWTEGDISFRKGNSRLSSFFAGKYTTI